MYKNHRNITKVPIAIFNADTITTELIIITHICKALPGKERQTRSFTISH